jgi:hypothetical protein
MTRLIAVAVLAATLAACAPRVTTRVYGNSYPALPAESEVRLFSVRVPECPFEEIALVSVFPQPRMLIRAPQREVFQALRQRARELGGNAVVGMTEVQAPEGSGLSDGVKGTVVRFAAPNDCADRER